jgi:hypothetical protein
MFVLLGYPAMACVVVGMEMTSAERECCKRMAQQCGSMKMPTSHSCCQTNVQRPNSMLRSAAVRITPPTLGRSIDLSIIPAIAEVRHPLERVHPPPETPPSASSILRI